MKQQTDNTTKEAYVEPENFKGTRGDWDINYGNICAKNLVVAKMIIVDNRNGNYGEYEANRSLVSQSKEMAKALQNELLFLNAMLSSEKNETYRTLLIKRMNNIEQVLKNAGL
jgi:hypothetical protein